MFRRTKLSLLSLILIIAGNGCKKSEPKPASVSLEKLVEKTEPEPGFWVKKPYTALRKKPLQSSDHLMLLPIGSYLRINKQTPSTKGWKSVTFGSHSGWIQEQNLSSESLNWFDCNGFFDCLAGEAPICTAGGLGSSDCGQLIENKRIISANTVIKRRGKELLINTAENGPVILRDKRQDESHLIVYQFIRHLARAEYVLIHEQYFEGHAFLLISLKNGKRKLINSEPKFNPAETLFLTRGETEGFNSILLYKIQDQAVTKIWEANDSLLRDGYWESDLKYRFFREGDSYKLDSTVILTNTSGKWQIKP